MNSRAALVRGKVVLQIPRVVFGMLGWLTVGALLPRELAWVLFVVLVGGGLASLVAQRAMVRLIWWAWRTGRGF